MLSGQKPWAGVGTRAYAGRLRTNANASVSTTGSTSGHRSARLRGPGAGPVVAPRQDDYWQMVIGVTCSTASPGDLRLTLSGHSVTSRPGVTSAAPDPLTAHRAG